MILQFNERELDTDEYAISFEEGYRADYHDDTFGDIMRAMDITDDEVYFSTDQGEDGLPESEDSPVDVTLFKWVADYNYKILEPYNDKETNILINDIGEDGIQLLYIYHHDLAADSDYNDEQFEILSHLFDKMNKEDRAYGEVAKVINQFQDGALRSDETYLLLKIRFTDKDFH
jgi:hypothetical protein